MDKQELHLIHLARVEIGWYSVLAQALNTEATRKVDWEQAKKEFVSRGCMIDNEDFGAQKQIDIFGTFVNFTLCWNEEKGYFVGYGWVLDDYNTDLYAHKVGDFRPYYDEKSKQDWRTR